MGARKNINVTGANKNTAAVSAGADITLTHWRIVASDDTTVKSNFKTLDTARTVSAGGSLNVADAGIYLTIGAAGGTGQTFPDATHQANLDRTTGTGALANTDLIQWSTDGTTKTSRLASTSVDAWDAAITF